MRSGAGDEGDVSEGEDEPTDLTPEEARRVLTTPTPTERQRQP